MRVRIEITIDVTKKALPILGSVFQAHQMMRPEIVAGMIAMGRLSHQ
jgi:hypothetical protein